MAKRLTKKDIERLGKKWMLALGLGEWTVICEFEKPCSDGNNAEVKTMRDHHKAWISFAPEWRDWDYAKANRIICHELLHVATRDLDWVVRFLIEDSLSDDERALILKTWTHVDEAFTDRLAVSLSEVL